MAFPTVVVTPGTGQTINTLPSAGQATGANSLPVVLASDIPGPIALTDPAKVTGSITVVDSGTTPATNTAGQTTVTGSPTANSFVVATCTGNSSLRIQLVSNATATGTVVVEKSLDGGTTYLTAGISLPGATAPGTVASITFAAAIATYVIKVNAAAGTTIRVRATAMSGSTPSVAVTMQPGYGVEDVSIPAQVTTGSASQRVTTNFTRPANTTTYATGQVLSTSTSSGVVLTFTNCARYAGGTGTILSAEVVDSASQAVHLQANLYLFTAAPSTTINDGAAWAPSLAEMETCVGVMQLTSWFGSTTTSAPSLLADYNEVRKFVCASGSKTLYGVLVVLNAYVPLSGEQFYVTLGLEQD